MTPAELLDRVAPPPQGGFLIALSGGPDSAVAAWVLSQMVPDRIRAIHVHHGMPAAELLAEAAITVAGQLDCEIDVVTVDVPPGASWEGQARAVRWAAIEERRTENETVVTGHHADDLAETTLGHLLRGAGATGLASMAVNRPAVWRPLLGIDGESIAAVAAQLGLTSIDDPANYDLTHFRNVLRHDVIPQLEAAGNPQLRGALTRTAFALAADDQFIESAMDPVVPRQDVWGAWRIPAPLITTAQSAVAVRLVRRLLRAARPPYAGTSDEIDAALEVVHAITGGRDISDGWRLELEGPWLVLHRGSVLGPNPTHIDVPGSVAFGKLVIAARRAPSVVVRRTSLLASAAVGSTLAIRAAAAGERIEIADGSKLIRDVLAEAEIPRRLRSAWPVAEAHGRIVAVAGIRSAPWGRGRAGHEGVIELTVEEGQN